MGIESDFIWFDGEFVPFDKANVHVLSHTLHYGVGVFEGIRAYTQPDGRPGIWRAHDHMRRFVDSMRMMRMPCKWTIDELVEACLLTVERNNFNSAYLRPLAFFGAGEMGLGARHNPVHIAIASWHWGAYLGDEGMEKGVRVATSSYTRHHPNAALQRAKVVGHYVNSVMARYEANANGYDEAIMLDHNGYVAEGTGENLFVIRDNTVYTPSSFNILPGITRASLLDILRHDGIQVVEGLFGRDALYTADEVFMCGTAAEVTPIRAVDHVSKDNVPGPITRHVQRTYLDAVHGRIDWLLGSITRR